MNRLPAHRATSIPSSDPVLDKLNSTLARFRAADAHPDPVLARLDATLLRIRKENAERDAADDRVRITDGDVAAMQGLVADLMVERVIHGDTWPPRGKIAEGWEEKHSAMTAFIQAMQNNRDEFRRIKDERVMRAMENFRTHGGIIPAGLREAYNEAMRRGGVPTSNS